MTLKGIFTGSIQITLLVILTLFFLRFLWEILMDLLFKDVKRYINWFFFFGSFLHLLWHALIIKLLGYEVKVNFNMYMLSEDFASQSLSGDLKNVWHAFLIGIAPLINFIFLIFFLHFSQEIEQYFTWIGMQGSFLLVLYIKICLIFFGLPELSDLLLPFTTATAKHSEAIFLFLIGLFCFIIALGIWGWLIPLINFLIYSGVVLYLISQNYFTKRNQTITKGFDADAETI